MPKRDIQIVIKTKEQTRFAIKRATALTFSILLYQAVLEKLYVPSS